MSRKWLRSSGYSLVELLLVLVIVGILALAGVMTIGNKRGSSVKSVMNQIEGVLAQGQQNAMRGGKDVPLLASGTTCATMLLETGALNVGVSYPATAADAVGISRSQGELEQFRGSFDRYAGILPAGADANKILNDLKSIPTCAVDPLLSAFDLCLFSGTDPVLVRITGDTKRFGKGFVIPVVPYVNGTPVITEDVGVIVVPPLSLTSYKFYRAVGSTQWRRM